MQSIRHVLVACALGAALPAAAQERPLTPDDVASGWVGKTGFGTTANGAKVELRLLADGTASVIAGSTADTGSWRLSDKGFCTTWKSIRAGQERCFTGVVKGSAVHVFNPDGSFAGQYTEFK